MPGDEDDDAALLQVADGPPQDERLRDLVHRDGALDPGRDPHLLQAVHDRHAVDDSRQHPHVVAGRPVYAALLPGQSPEDVARRR